MTSSVSQCSVRVLQVEIILHFDIVPLVFLRYTAAYVNVSVSTQPASFYVPQELEGQCYSCCVTYM